LASGSVSHFVETSRISTLQKTTIAAIPHRLSVSQQRQQIRLAAQLTKNRKKGSTENYAAELFLFSLEMSQYLFCKFWAFSRQASWSMPKAVKSSFNSLMDKLPQKIG